MIPNLILIGRLMLHEGHTPDTSQYLTMGLVVTAVLSVGYLVSLVVRFRGLRKDAELLQALKDENATLWED